MTENKLKAICVLHQNKNSVEGVINFSQNNKTNKVRVQYTITGLSDGLYLIIFNYNNHKMV